MHVLALSRGRDDVRGEGFLCTCVHTFFATHAVYAARSHACCALRLMQMCQRDYVCAWCTFCARCIRHLFVDMARQSGIVMGAAMMPHMGNSTVRQTCGGRSVCCVHPTRETPIYFRLIKLATRNWLSGGRHGTQHTRQNIAQMLLRVSRSGGGDDGDRKPQRAA